MFVSASLKWFCQESTLQTAEKNNNNLTTGFWNNLKCHSRKWVWGKKRGKKHDAELRFEATETDENLPENGNFGGRRRRKKKKANMIKSVSQWLVAFSRHGERRVKIRAPREKPLVTPAAKTVLRILPAGERSESLGETTWTAVWWQNKTLLEVFWSTADATNKRGNEVSGPEVWLWAAGPTLPTESTRSPALNCPTVLHKYVSGGKPRALLKYLALPRKVTQWGRRCGWMWLPVQGGHK